MMVEPRKGLVGCFVPLKEKGAFNMPVRYHGTVAWKRLRLVALQRDGFRCAVPGCGKPATHVDHVQRRADGGADTLGNLRSLCAEHDNQVKERPDGKRAGGGVLRVKGCDAQGNPRDPGHWWRK